MKRTAVINVVGLTEGLIGAATPHLARFRQAGAGARIRPAFPAVTCTAQANYLTGLTPSRHGVVGNGWYHRELAEVHFWKQSNHIVTAPKIWDQLRAIDPTFTCAQLFWWFNMYSGADFSITPRPAYPADGRKIFDIYTSPAALRAEIKKELGEFPFATFWGPAAGRQSPQGSPDAASRWIAAAAKWIEELQAPTLQLIYLPHLDYNLQRLGPAHPGIARDLAEIDAIVGDLISFFAGRGVQCVILSEYGIEPVNAPVHLNRLFREQGWLAIREELGLELLDCGASRVFAVADHQVAHVYVNDATLRNQVRALLEKQPGVELVLDDVEKEKIGVQHGRAGDLVAVAQSGAWFTYYYWLEDCAAPDFARTVDIHRKPGYDPVELFLDPAIPAVKWKIIWRLLQKRLGFRMLMDVIPLDASLVKGSHGRRPADPAGWPALLCDKSATLPAPLDSTEVCGFIKNMMGEPPPRT
ncbi:MAG TPA: alkaline phosphatase family protein [Verrucomicrobiae bacterium]|jgi:predicted AlkP superfamily pyrophosphatase or phosphodiesterase|nr:alkaline phosphatase family protein [Verrucomicrobiae bacterium]